MGLPDEYILPDNYNEACPYLFQARTWSLCFGARAQTAMGGHCSLNGTPTRKPSAQTLPPEIERRDRDR